MRREWNRFGAVAFALVGVHLTACGTGAADNDYSPGPLAVIHGEVTNEAALTLPRDIRAALLWWARGAGGEDNPLTVVAQETAVLPVFPSSFSLLIDSLPPESAMWDGAAVGALQPGVRIVTGSLIVYTDSNANGRLDLPAALDEPIGDLILGMPKWVSVVYVEGAPAVLDEGAGVMIPTGFSIIQEPDMSLYGAAAGACAEAHPESDEAFEACMDDAGFGADWSSPPVQVLPVDTPVTVPLTTEPKLPGLICTSFSGADFEELFTAAYLRHVMCDADGRGFTFVCEVPGPLTAADLCFSCEGDYRHVLPPEAEPDEGWPCPMQ